MGNFNLRDPQSFPIDNDHFAPRNILCCSNAKNRIEVCRTVLAVVMREKVHVEFTTRPRLANYGCLFLLSFILAHFQAIFVPSLYHNHLEKCIFAEIVGKGEKECTQSGTS